MKPRPSSPARSETVSASLSALLCLAALAAAAPAPTPEDTITLHGGETVVGRIVGTREGKVRLEQRIGQGRAEMAFATGRIAAIHFASAFDPAALPADPRDRIRDLRSLWDQRAPLKGVDGSETGAIACALASCLLDLGLPQDALSFVATQDDARGSCRDRLDALRVRALAASGKIPEALGLARELERRSSDPASIAGLALAAGELELARTNADVAIDHFLRNSILNPESPEAAEGLWRAAQVALAQTNLTDARRWLEDIARDHTRSAILGQAREAIANLPPPEKGANDAP